MVVAGLLLAAGAGRRLGTPKALVQDWREQRDRAFALFDVCIDVIARVPVLGDKTVYPPNDFDDDGKEEDRHILCTQTLLKQMEQLGGLLEKMDRERDAMKRSVDDMEKGHREATKALNNAAQRGVKSTSATTALTAVKKGGAPTEIGRAHV